MSKLARAWAVVDDAIRRLCRRGGLAVAWVLAALCLGCEAGPRGGTSALPASSALPALPPAVLAELAPGDVAERVLADGVVYRRLLSPRGPWAVHLVAAEAARCDLALRVVPALADEGRDRARVVPARMAPRAPATALAGVNGDFFRLDNGAPLGPEVTRTTRRLAARPALAWRPGGEPWIGTPERAAGGMVFGADTVLAAAPLKALEPGEADATDGRAGPEGGPGPDPAAAQLQVVGGFPELLDQGLVVGDLGVEDNPAFAAGRHPRTAVGWDADEGVLWLVVVDGRQAPRSAGMSLPELADLLLWLGAEEALNLDGGGSSAMLLGDEVVSSPSDATGQRPVGNSLWLVADPDGCSATG